MPLFWGKWIPGAQETNHYNVQGEGEEQTLQTTMWAAILLQRHLWEALAAPRHAHPTPTHLPTSHVPSLLLWDSLDWLIHVYIHCLPKRMEAPGGRSLFCLDCVCIRVWHSQQQHLGSDRGTRVLNTCRQWTWCLICLTSTLAALTFQALLEVTNGHCNPMKLYEDFLHFPREQKGSEAVAQASPVMQCRWAGLPVRSALLPTPWRTGGLHAGSQNPEFGLHEVTRGWGAVSFDPLRRREFLCSHASLRCANPRPWHVISVEMFTLQFAPFPLLLLQRDMLCHPSWKAVHFCLPHGTT